MKRPTTATSPVADDGLPPLRDVIQRHGLSAKKSLGQNFILDLNLTRRIARVCGDLEGRVVVEVGPGPGGLTRALLHQGARTVVAVERDARCKPALDMIAEAWPGRLNLHMADALDFDWRRHVLEDTGADPADVLVISNLPYSIATRLLVSWLEVDTWPPWYGAMGLMFQREVAERIVAGPGTKAYGRLAIISQWSCETKIALTLPPAAFTPPPKVASAVVTFTPRPFREPDCTARTLGRVTAALFGQRRKMLRVSLRQLTPMPELLIEAAGLDPMGRGEDVDVASIARLAQCLDRGISDS